jgi:4-hydroxy-3-methylbut-2-enyl diphosphate reductase
VRAIDIVELALKKYGPPVYVRHEIVHNKRVVEDLKAKGAIFVEELDEVPDGAHTVFSAHGVSQNVADTARLRALPVIDATCPLVAKVHKEGQRYAKANYEVILIGHEGHPEVVGTMGRIPGIVHLVSSAEAVATREVIDALRKRFPAVVGPDVKDICYATQNRQTAVRRLAGMVDVLLVVGAQNSSNSNRLREIGEELDVPSYLIDDARALKPEWLEGAAAVGISAGASAPEALVQELIERLSELAEIQVEHLDGINENVQFKLPDELRGYAA